MRVRPRQLAEEPRSVHARAAAGSRCHHRHEKAAVHARCCPGEPCVRMADMPVACCLLTALPSPSPFRVCAMPVQQAPVNHVCPRPEPSVPRPAVMLRRPPRQVCWQSAEMRGTKARREGRGLAAVTYRQVGGHSRPARDMQRRLLNRSQACYRRSTAAGVARCQQKCRASRRSPVQWCFMRVRRAAGRPPSARVQREACGVAENRGDITPGLAQRRGLRR